MNDKFKCAVTTTVKMVADKLIVNSNVSTEAFELNSLDTTMPASEPILLETLLHSSPVTVKGSKFQGHLHLVHTQGDLIQAIRVISQHKQLAKSNHTMCAYNFIDPEGVDRCGYFADREWTGGSILSSLLHENELSNVIIITRSFGRVHLGKKRFELIRQVVNEMIALCRK